jgi:hypothetical protein
MMPIHPDELLFETDDATCAVTVLRHYDAVTGEPRIRVELTLWNHDTTFVYSLSQAARLADVLGQAVSRAIEQERLNGRPVKR